MPATLLAPAALLSLRRVARRSFNVHTGSPPGDELGWKLGDEFDRTYVTRVSPETAGLFPGIDRLLRSLSYRSIPPRLEVDTRSLANSRNPSYVLVEPLKTLQ